MTAIPDNSFKIFGKKINQALNAADVKNFDPMRFAFIQSLSQRIAEPRHASNAVLIEKARSSAQQYTRDLAVKRQQASKIIDRISSGFPEHLEAAQALYECYQFKQLEQLNQSLSDHVVTGGQASALHELINEFNQRTIGSFDSAKPQSLDELLNQQEQFVRIVADEEPSPPELDVAKPLPELQSMLAYRESMKHVNIDRVIARAIDDGPENPGPHNPQMLAIDALMQMRDLSPAYLRRFAGYVETLLWLENPGLKLSAKKKRP